jgi:AcrR family transcriptional regulator
MRSRSRLGLTREWIIDAADQILRESGLAGLTMRAVADRVGVGTMTLYGYFRDKDELLDALIDTESAKLDVPRATGPWRPRLRALMVALHDQLAEHPLLVELRLRRPLASPGALLWTEIGLEALQDAGLSAGEAARAFRPLFIYTFGHAIFLPRDRPEQVVRDAHAALLRLPPDQFPGLTSAAAEMAGTLAGSEAFEYGLDRLLDGIEMQLSTRSS